MVTYLLIVTERTHKTTAAMLGASAMMLVLLISGTVKGDPFGAIDLEVIFLLVGMMMIVNVTAKTGLFQWMAIRSIKVAKGRPIAILILFSVVTALSSSILDNVTTVILVAPVTVLMANQLKIDPVPFLLCETLASNIGGTATLIGDPPNLMIGMAAGLSFTDFLLNLGPLVVIILAAFAGMQWLFFRKRLRVSIEQRARVMEFDESKSITDKPLAIKCVSVLAATLVAFLFQGKMHVSPAVIALAGASVLMLISKASPEVTLERVEWTTLFFFIGLFIVVGGAEEVGLMKVVADRLADLAPTGGGVHMGWMSIIVLWISGVLSAVVDNVPYTAAMIPVIKDAAVAMNLSASELNALWWALAAGACLGGNGTIIGAAANVIVVGFASKNGYPITFRRFLKYGLPITFISFVIASIYFYVRYV